MTRLTRSALAFALLPLACAAPEEAPPGSVDAHGAQSRTFATHSDVLDVLFVVDNSGSMLEEQQELVRAFFELDPDKCPIADARPSPAQNVSGDMVRDELAQCGLLQLLGAAGYDWRVGVVTTDVGVCDNRGGALQGDGFCAAAPDAASCVDGAWGFRPQRGCLQPGGPPGADAPRVLDADVADPAAWFGAVLDNVRTFGSPWERGLDAAELFLDPGTARAPGCADDLAAFRRPDAELLVVVLTDEDDCSRGSADWVADETAGEVCGEDLAFFQANAQRCYDDAGALPDAAQFADRLLAREPEARVVVVGGAHEGAAAGCRLEGAGGAADGAVVTEPCWPSGGLSNFTGAGQPCGPDGEAELNGMRCCTADPATRYEQFVAGLDQRGRLMSICEPSLLPLVRDVALALMGAE